MKEENLHKQICDYIELQYPSVIFNTDMSGIKLTMGQAKKASQLRSDPGFPDVGIYEIYKGSGSFIYSGLFMEVKIKTPYKKDGTLNKMTRYEVVNGIKVAYDHLQRQADLHKRLRERGFKCEFVWTFDQAKDMIDEYLGKIN